MRNEKNCLVFKFISRNIFSFLAFGNKNFSETNRKATCIDLRTRLKLQPKELIKTYTKTNFK